MLTSQKLLHLQFFVPRATGLHQGIQIVILLKNFLGMNISYIPTCMYLSLLKDNA